MSETVNGTSIPLRKLTDEEYNRDITLERFRGYHHSAGEDFIDQTGEGNAVIFCGWLLHKYPDKSKEILDIANSNGKYLSITDFSELDGLGYSEEEDIELVYSDFAEFCNHTEHLKKRVNQILIQVTEYYGIPKGA